MRAGLVLEIDLGSPLKNLPWRVELGSPLPQCRRERVRVRVHSAGPRARLALRRKAFRKADPSPQSSPAGNAGEEARAIRRWVEDDAGFFNGLLGRLRLARARIQRAEGRRQWNAAIPFAEC
jgi:hypothetical protein